MLESLYTLIREIRGNLRPVDVIDMLLVSVFIYAMLLWFRRTATRGVWIGVGGLTLLYVLARSLDMYLTSLAFHATFAVLLFALVVVFQEDFRRLLETLASLGSMRLRSADRGDTADWDAVVEAVFQMARERTGALIVVQGREPLQRHLHGGNRVDGRISEWLLLSIFDSSTPGHDGAVVIAKNRLNQFAAHLPISKNSRQIAGRGTRHSAALGLSERSDALTIVVSEERGEVGVAESGKLHKIDSASALKRRLLQFCERVHPQSQPWRPQRLLQHGHLKLFSVAIAVIAWFALAYDADTVQRIFVAPIEYKGLPAQLELDRTAPTEARVMLSGLERDFRLFDPATLKLSFDLSQTQQGYQEILVTEEQLRMPPNLSLYSIEPRILRLYLGSSSAAERAGAPRDGL